MDIYFPSCNLTKVSPQASFKIRMYLKNKMQVTNCCRREKRTFTNEDRGIVVCQDCRSNVEVTLNLKTKTLWEYIDEEDPDFKFPDYHGMKVNLQDCFRDHDRPEVYQAIRNLLTKMNIEVVEVKENTVNSRFCGTYHYETKSEALKMIMGSFGDSLLSSLPNPLQQIVMRDNIKKYKCEIVVCYCNRCLRGINLGGAKGVHILDLLMGTYKK